MKVEVTHPSLHTIWWESNAPGPAFQSHMIVDGSTRGAVGGSFDRTLVCCIELMKALNSNEQDCVLIWLGGDFSGSQLLPMIERLCNAYQSTPCLFQQSFRGLHKQGPLWGDISMYASPDDFMNILGADGGVWRHGIFAVGADARVVDEWLQLSLDHLSADRLLESCSAIIWTDAEWEDVGVACLKSKVDVVKSIIERA